MAMGHYWDQSPAYEADGMRGSDQLYQWCEAFCRDSSGLKTFKVYVDIWGWSQDEIKKSPA